MSDREESQQSVDELPSDDDLLVPVSIKRTRRDRLQPIAPSQRLRTPTAKAQSVLGRDVSRDKLMSRLGLQPDELDQARQECVERHEQSIKRRRLTVDNRDKKHARKALDRLGHDPSASKVIRQLGLDESELQRVKEHLAERLEGDFERCRAADTGIRTRRSSAKALQVLGQNPSESKAKLRLGITDDEFEIALQDLARTFEMTLERQRQQANVFDKRNTRKAQRVLGLDPSSRKLSQSLGVDAAVAAEAQRRPGETLDNLVAAVAASAAAAAGGGGGGGADNRAPPSALRTAAAAAVCCVTTLLYVVAVLLLSSTNGADSPNAGCS